VRALGLEARDDGLQITETARQPVDPRDHQRLARMDEIQDRPELGPPVEAGPALLLRPDHAAAGRPQRAYLRLEVLLGGRGARIADFRGVTVHFGCALGIICSLCQNRPKMNSRKPSLRVQRKRHQGYTLSDAFIQIDFEAVIKVEL
jgi:hypothetical protein